MLLSQGTNIETSWTKKVPINICLTIMIFLIMTCYQRHAKFFGSERGLGGNTQALRKHLQTVRTVHFLEGRTPFCTECAQWQGNTLAQIKCPWTAQSVQFHCSGSTNKHMEFFFNTFHCCEQFKWIGNAAAAKMVTQLKSVPWLSQTCSELNKLLSYQKILCASFMFYKRVLINDSFSFS